MKRIIALCAGAALLLSLLSACGNSGDKNSEPVQESQAVQESEPAGAASQPAEESEPVQESEPAQTPTLADGQADLAAFVQAMQENHEFPALERADPNDPDVGSIMLANYYPGIAGLDLEQIEIHLPVASYSGGEIALAQAKSAEDAAKVKEIFQARKDAKSEDGIGNYPEELEAWQNSSRLVEHDNYVLLVCHEDCDAIVDSFNALFS